jgi:hypothetical protein
MDSPPVSFPGAFGVANLTESLFSVKTHTLLASESRESNPRRRDAQCRMFAGRVEFGHDFNGVVRDAASRNAVNNGEVPGRWQPIPATGRFGSTNWGVPT